MIRTLKKERDKKMKKTIIIALSLVLVLLAFTSCEEEIHVHTWDEGTVTKAASCTEDGEVVYKCACGEKKTQVIKATGHKLVETIVDSTYLKKGSVTVKCSECEKYPVSTYTLDRKDATGLGGELILKVHESSNPETDPDLYMYMSFAILPNNEVISFSTDDPIDINSDTINLYEYIADYIIKEEINEEGEVSYSISLNDMSIPVIEKDGKLTVSYTLPFGEIQKQDIVLTPDFHVHTGKEVILCEDTDTPEQSFGDPCMYFKCETEKCLTIADKKVSVVANATHDFENWHWDSESRRWTYDPCSICGVKYNVHAE